MRNIPKRTSLFVKLLVVAVLAFGSVSLIGCESDKTSKSESKGSLKIGWIPWDEDVAVSYLWKQLLEEEGYDVELTQLDVAPLYMGLAKGELDLFLDTWLPVTHSDYWAKYGDDIDKLGVWYYNAILTMAVPSYVDIDSVDELVGNEELFDGQVIGIEPGAGLTRITREEVMPGYGLGGYELVEGSTTAMLSELTRATSKNEPLVVTLWRPHWAYGAFDIKDLEDPKGLLGEAEEISSLSRKGFSDDFPEVAGWIGDFKMNDEQLSSLSQLVIDEYGVGQEEEAVIEWLSDPENRALADGWLGK